MIKILIVEDEKPISELIRMSVEDAGYFAACASDGEIAADILENNSFDLVLLDIMLPKVNGYELLEYIRPLEIPAIFITAMTSVDDRVKGLLKGAEDYIVKPFAVTELLARIEVVLRRFHKLDTNLIYEEYTIDTCARIVRKNGNEIPLTKKEFDLFVLLVRNKGITLFRDKLFELVWETEYDGYTRTLDLHIQRVRKKLALNDRLKSVYKIGYRLRG